MVQGPHRTTWNTSDFDVMGWHDNHVHALRIVEGENGTGKLILDIDYILEWRLAGDGRYHFLIAPAALRFSDVENLRISIDYKQTGFGEDLSAAHGPFSLEGITRRNENREHFTAQIWTIELNFPKGEIEFEATGFDQENGEAILCKQQHLPANLRAIQI